jgi:hypothetical protein
MTHDQKASKNRSSNNSTMSSSPLFQLEGVKEHTKRRHLRKNGLQATGSKLASRPPAVSTTSLFSPPTRLAAKQSGNCCRILFGPVDHNEVLVWLNECQDQRRRQLNDKYGFDVTLAEEGVYAAAPTASSTC